MILAYSIISYSNNLICYGNNEHVVTAIRDQLVVDYWSRL